MGSTTQKKSDEKEESGRIYDTASLRHLPIEVQIRHRQDQLDTWMRLREQEHCLKKGTVKYTAEEVAKTAGVSVMTLYNRKKSHTCTHTQVLVPSLCSNEVGAESM